MSDRAIKIILWLIALGAAWDLGRSYVLINSLLLFAVSGVVPGTNHTLTPDQTLWFDAIFLSVSVLLIFSTNMRRSLRHLFGYKAIEDEIETETLITLRQQNVDLEYVPPKEPSKLRLVVRELGAVLRRYTIRFLRMVARRSPKMAELAMRLWQICIVQASRIISIVKIYAGRSRKYAHAMVVAMAIFTAIQASRFWRWAEPYLRKTDDWLGAQYKKGSASIRSKDSIKALIRLSHETDKVVLGWRDDAKDMLSRVFEK